MNVKFCDIKHVDNTGLVIPTMHWGGGGPYPMMHLAPHFPWIEEARGPQLQTSLNIPKGMGTCKVGSVQSVPWEYGCNR